MSEQYSFVKIRNSQRINKKKKQVERGKPTTPPKYFDKESMCNKYSKFQRQMGFEYQCNDNQTLKWMKQQFQQKTVKYLGGNSEWAKRKGRMDKVRRKQQVNCQIKKNPMLKVFRGLDEKVRKMHIFDAFHTILKFNK